MKRCREVQTTLDAIAAGSPAQRAFGSHMYSFWLKGVQPFGEQAFGSNGQIYAGIARAWPGLEQAGVNHLDRVAQLLQFAHEFNQCRHDTVDLRLPGIGDECNLHVFTDAASAALVANSFGLRPWVS